MNARTRDTRPYRVIIDPHEKDNGVTKRLLERIPSQCEFKHESPYDPTADYIVIGRDGTTWGIERKSFLDCWQSICDKRIDGQLAQLSSAYPSRAIFLLESPTYFPKNLQHKVQTVKRAVYTFLSERSLLMPCWVAVDQQHSADLIIKLAKRSKALVISGRGKVVARDEL